MDAVTSPEGRESASGTREITCPTCLRGLDVLQDELDAAVQHLDGAVLCDEVFSHWGVVRPRLRRCVATPPPTSREAPAVTLTSGVLATACCCHSGHMVHPNAFRLLCGQSVGQLSKQHGGLWGTESQKQETPGAGCVG